MMRLAFDEILYIRSDGNYCVMTLSNGEEIQLWMNLKAITELIDQQMRQQEIVFVRVGKQYVLNLHYISRIDTKKDQLSLWRKELSQKIVLDYYNNLLTISSETAVNHTKRKHRNDATGV